MIPLYIEEGSTALITQIESDLGATVKSNQRNLPIKNPLFYNSSPVIVLNDPTDDRDDTYDVEDVGIQPFWDHILEPHAERDGSIGGPPREVQKVITIRGFVRADSLAKLHDKIAALNRAFNPVLTYQYDVQNSDYDIGFVPLEFYTPTTNTTDWPNGYIPQMYYVRSRKMPVSVSTQFDDFQARFSIELLAVDPRKYEQSTQLAERTGSGLLAINNLKATYDSWPIVKITFSTVPSADFNYKLVAETGTADEDLKIVYLESTELADSSGETLIIDHQQRRAYYQDDEENKIAAIISNSKFFKVMPALNQDITFSANLPANAAVDVVWRRAFV